MLTNSFVVFFFLKDHVETNGEYWTVEIIAAGDWLLTPIGKGGQYWMVCGFAFYLELSGYSWICNATQR